MGLEGSWTPMPLRLLPTWPVPGTLCGEVDQWP